MLYSNVNLAGSFIIYFQTVKYFKCLVRIANA